MTEKYKDIIERYSWDERSTYVKASDAFDNAMYVLDRLTTGNLAHNLPNVRIKLERLLVAYLEESEKLRIANREIRKLKKELNKGG